MSLEFIPAGADPVLYDGIELIPDDNVTSSPMFNGWATAIISFWTQVYPAVPAANLQHVFFAETPPGNNSRVEVQITPARLVNVQVRAPDAAAAASVLSTGVVPAETAAALAYPRQFWQVFIDLPNDTITLYVNGALDSVHAALGLNAAFDATNSGHASFGYQVAGVGPGSQGHNGKISDLRIYEGEILTLDLHRTMYRMNGHDGFVGNTRKHLQSLNHWNRRNGGAVAVLADVPDESPAQTIPVPSAIKETPTFRDWQHAFRRF